MPRRPSLDWEGAKRARQLYGWQGQRGMTIPALAAMFGVSETVIWKAVNRVAPYDRKRNFRKGAQNAETR